MQSPEDPSSATLPAQPPAEFYRPLGYQPNESVGYLMKRVLVLFSAEIDRQLGEHDLTNSQWGPLFKIASGCTGTVAELARECQTDNGGMTRMLDRLEAKGFLRRVRSTSDRRVVNVELTPEGQDAAAKVPPVLTSVMNGYLAGFTREEWVALLGYLQRMLANAEAMKTRGSAAEDRTP